MKMAVIKGFMVRFMVKIWRIRRITIMARHGENIRKRADGRWEGRYPTYSEVKQQQIYRSVYGRSYKEVKDKLAIQKDCLKEPSRRNEATDQFSYPLMIETVTIPELAEEWLIEVKEKRKYSTYVKYQFIYQCYIEKNFASVKVEEMTDSLTKERLPEPLSDSIRKSIYCVLNRILTFASQKYSVAIPSLKSSISCVRNKPIEVLNRKEQTKLLSVLCHEMDIFKMAVLLCMYTGLRLGEVCALKWSDIDFKNHLLMVNRTVQRICIEGYQTKTILLETEPKSEFSRREIPLSPSAMELLVQFHHDREYVFGKNKPMEPRTLQKHFKKIIEETRLEHKNFHILRHTFATNCIEGGIDVKSLSEILGHSDVQITLNRYVHPSMDIKRKHLNALSIFYGQIYGQIG